MREVMDRLLTTEIFSLMLVFARFGTAFSLMPGFADATVPVRARLLLAAAITIIIAPVLGPHLPKMPGNVFSLLLLLGGEILVGVFLGTVLRLGAMSLDIAGTIVGFQSGLASATIFNPALAEQGSLVASLLSATAVIVIFDTNLYQLLLRGIVDSYTLLSPGALPPIGDFSEIIVRTSSRVFRVGVQLAAPFLVSGLLLMVGFGLLSRLMPQLQVFFVALPLQMFLGFVVLAICLPAMLLYWADSFSGFLAGMLQPG